MRKRLITPSPQNAPPLDEGWLDLGGAAVVEVTSEEKEYPVEPALVSGEKRGLACRRFWHSDHPAKDFWSPNSLPVPSQQITMFLAASHPGRNSAAADRLRQRAFRFRCRPITRRGLRLKPLKHRFRA